MTDRRSLVGRRFVLPELLVNTADCHAYAHAVGDDTVRHVSRGTASPFYSVRLLAPLWRRIYQAPELATADQLVLHAEQRMLFHRELFVNEILHGQAMVRNVVGSGFGDAAIIRSALSDQDDRAVVVMESTLMIQGSSGYPANPRRYTQPTKLDLAAEMSCWYGASTPQEYANAADDHNPLHLDDDLARRAGHPGRIVHGMCTLATGITALVNKLRTAESGRLGYLRTRFSRPVLPGSAVDFAAHRTGSSSSYLVSAKIGGRAVLKNTWFRLAGNG